MAKFEKIDKTKLTSGQHYSFIVAFNELVGDTESTNQKYLAALRAAYQAQVKEDECLKLTQGSELTKQLREQDLARDHNYGWLKRIVTVWVESGLEPEASAAAGIQRLVKLYKIDVNSQIDEETGLMDNFMNDVFSNETLRTGLNTLNVMRFFQAMSEANTQVKQLLAQRGRESSEKVVGALKAARAETDAAYNAVCEMIESFSVVADDPAPFEAIIKEWNATILRYKDMLKRKSTKDSPEDEDKPDVKPEPQPDGGDDSGSSDEGGEVTPVQPE